MYFLCRLAGIPISKSRGFSEDGNILGGFPDDAKADTCGGGSKGDEGEDEEERQEATSFRRGHPALNGNKSGWGVQDEEEDQGEW